LPGGAAAGLPLWNSAFAGLRSVALADAKSAARAQRWSVAALLLAVGDALAARFGAVTVAGELSGFTRAASGHCYFALKDADGSAATLRCAMFRRFAVLLDFQPREGQQVELRGRLGVYEARGELQMVVESMRPLGEGTLYEQFLRLKARLEAEGLFDAARKRAPAAFPGTLGVVTSHGAAALHDVLTTLERRAPHVRVVVYPSLVQGAEAPAALVDAIATAGRRREVDTLIVCRGGGSLEDLWAFNDERVVRAVAASPIPVICGVGHETDVTLADFAADLRAPTPTAAAELAAPSQREALDALAALAQRLCRPMHRALEQQAQRLDQRALQLARPSAVLATHRQRLALVDQRAQTALRHAIERANVQLPWLAARLGSAARARWQRQAAALDTLEARLAALDPKQVLARGYAWVTDEARRPIVSVGALAPGQRVHAVWADGEARAQVLSVHPAPSEDRG
jgi:exodeoxyribonuclease VII large subunit